MKNKAIFIIFSLIFLFSAQICGAEGYRRIISLAPSVTESLYELGMDREVIAVTVYCPKGKSKKEIIGTLLEPDIEKIVMLKPDLIVSTKEGNSKAAVEKIQRLGFDVFVMENSANFQEICDNFQALAQKVGKEKIGGKIVEAAQKEALKIYSRIMLMPKESVFWEVGAKPLYTAGKQSFVNDYNYYTSTVNIYNDINMRYPPVNIEDVIERNPGIIILVNMGDISGEELKTWKKYAAVSAAQNNKIYMIEADDIFTPTPAAFAKGVKLLASTIFPEIFSGK
jgi:iron complex transport system substrate-binding protein